MTLTSTVPKEIKNGNGSATSFSFDFVINRPDDLKVYLNGSDTPLTEGTGATNYSVSVSTYPGNGSITYPAMLGTKLATGETLTLARVVDLDQDTDLQNQGKYKPETVEQTFDYSRMIDIQQQEQIDRSLKARFLDNSGADYTVPTPAANKVIGIWNSAGTAMEEGPTANEISNAQTYATNASASAITAASSATAAASSDANAQTAKIEAQTAETNAKAAQALAESAASSASIAYNFDSSTAMNDLGSGDFRMNNAIVSSVTSLALDALTADTDNPDLSDWVATWGSASGSNKGEIIIRNRNTPANFAIFTVTAPVTDNTSWLKITVSYVAGSGTFSDADACYLQFLKTGDTGTVANWIVDNYTDIADYTSGSTTQLTLTSNPGTENNISVTFDGVTQHHDTFSVSGTTLTFNTAIPLGVSNVEVQYGETLLVGIPSDGTITTAKLASNAVETSKISNNAVTLDKMAGGVAGNLISYDSVGNPAVVSTGSAGQVLTSNGVGQVPTFENVASGGGGLVNGIEVFTVDGTFTVPSGVTTIYVEIVGGGGGGGGQNGPGGSGGTTSFGSVISATGGGSGAGGANYLHTTGAGIGIGGDINLRGGQGGQGGYSVTGSAYTGNGGGIGGASFFGGGTGDYHNHGAPGSGGSGQSTGDQYGRAGGGAGGYAAKLITGLSAGSEFTVSIGQGGMAGSGNVNSAAAQKGKDGMAIVRW